MFKGRGVPCQRVGCCRRFAGKGRSRVGRSHKLGSWFALAAAILMIVAVRPVSAQSPASVLGVPCASVSALGIDKQDNMRAGLIRIGCGLEAGGEAGELESGGELAEGGGSTNINVITGTENYPKVTQSESMVWASTDGQTIVVNYNDSRTAPGNYSGVSVSTDGGATFTRLNPSPLATGHGTNFGDPVVVYNDSLATWFAGDIVSGGNCRSGVGLWTSSDGVNWTTGACAHLSGSDDRESMWVDNNPGSPYYGRMYVSVNDFAMGQRIFVTHSDDGTTWSTAVPLSSGFIRNIQLTGSQDVDGTVFVAGMNEGGGGVNPRTNIMYRSVDGGDTWTQIIMGPPFPAAGQAICGFFAAIPPIWRHQGWGQPGVGPGGVVHYAYAGRGVNTGDIGDIYYTQSLDNGDTWSDPIILNTDQLNGSNAAQWMPSLSVTADGKVQVAWYDRRNSTDNRNYEIWGIQSLDNGATWQPDAVISDVLIDQPEQPDSSIVSCYAGDYNYASAVGTINLLTWTDGRNPISGHFQQDVYFNMQP